MKSIRQERDWSKEKSLNGREGEEGDPFSLHTRIERPSSGRWLQRISV
jgi:hypothetical protein